MIDQYLIQKIPPHQLEICNELRHLCQIHLPNAKERLSFGVPHYYITKRIAFVWPTAIPNSGVKENGVLLGFWRGYKIQHQQTKMRGQSNKVVRFLVYQSLEEVFADSMHIPLWLTEALALDTNDAF